METAIKRDPKVRISYDEMEAYLTLPEPMEGEDYSLGEVLSLIESAGVKFGLDDTKVSAMIEEKYYNRECLVAKGVKAVDGVDGYYDFNFDSDLNKKPSRRDDGSVDYWSIHSVETVEEGQVIATYIEPIDGENGVNVKGKLLIAKRGRPQPPLTGKGFERSEDNKTYTATMTGKIEKQENRILISQVHEIHGDVGLTTGNIDFRGDVVIHGNVPTGAVIRATGSVTIDGNVEGCLIDANKDVIIRGGMLGHERGMIKTKGNLHIKFMEYGSAKVDGYVETDSVINCNIICNDRLYMRGKHASIVGGVTHAAAGVEAFNIGNELGVKTEVYAGVNMEVKKQITYHENCIAESSDMINKINIGIKQIEDVIKTQIANAQATDTEKIKALNEQLNEKKASLLRTKIVKQADLATHTQELNNMRGVVANAHGACIKVYRNVYASVNIGINDANVVLKEDQESVSFFERDGRVVMFSVKDELV